jgi:hypothetical protein
LELEGKRFLLDASDTVCGQASVLKHKKCFGTNARGDFSNTHLSFMAALLQVGIEQQRTKEM